MEGAGEESQLPRVLLAILTAGSPHLEACIVSVLAQDYPALEVLVVDVGGGRYADEVAASHGLRVITPPKGRGLAAGANAVLYEPVDHCEWIVFCHDDVALEPQAVRLLIEGALDAGAAVAGPKVRDWTHPEVLREVGFGIDRYGYHRSLVDPGESDRGQHDLIRDVFFVSAVCMAVHIGVLKATGGFDPGLDSLEEDLDLCWRARLLGYKVVAVPSAVVYHDPSDLDIPPVKNRDAVAQRNRMRVITKCYRPSRLVATLVSLLVQDVAEVAFRAATGRPPGVFRKLGVWLRYLLGLGPLMRARSATQRSRIVLDSDIAELQSKGSLRIRSALERQIHRESLEAGGEEPRALAGAGSGAWEFLLYELTRPTVIFWVAWVAFVVLASRNLLFSGLRPVVGQIGQGRGGLALLQDYFSPWHPDGLGYSGYSPTASLIAGAAQVLTAGSSAGAVKVYLPIAYLLGGWGVWTNVRRISGPGRWEGAAIATALYSLSAPVVASYERGSLSGIATAALLPWAVSLVYAPILGRKGFPRYTALLSVITFVMAAFEPLAPLLVAAASLGAVAGSAVAGKLWRSLSSVAMTVIGVGIGALLAYPSLVTDGAVRELISRVVEGWSDGRVQLGVGGVLRMHTTDVGAPPFGYALAVLAFGAVVFCRAERLAWVARMLLGAAIPGVGIWLAGQGHFPPVLESFPAVFCLGAMSFAISAGLAVDDLYVRTISQEKTSALAGLLLWPVFAVAVLAVAPGLLREAGGDLGIRKAGIDKALADAGVGGEGAEVSVLWLGPFEALPATPRPLPGGAGGAYAVTGPLPTGGLSRLAPRPEGFEEALSSVLTQMQSEGFTRGGKLLALLGVRYVAIPDIPKAYPVGSRPMPAGVLEGLSRQLDISEVRGTRGMRLFRVGEAAAMWTGTAVDSPVKEAVRESLDRSHRRWLDTELTGVAPVFDSVRLGAMGELDTHDHAAVILFKECDEGLRLHAQSGGQGGDEIRPIRVMGWACMFDLSGLARDGLRLTVRLGYESTSRRLTSAWLPIVGTALLLLLAAAARPREEQEYVPERLAALGDIEGLFMPARKSDSLSGEVSAGR